MAADDEAEIGHDDPYAPVPLEDTNDEKYELVGQIAGVCECGMKRPMVVGLGCDLWKFCCGRPVYA